MSMLFPTYQWLSGYVPVNPANNWGLAVVGDSTTSPEGESSGPGKQAWLISAGRRNDAVVTVTSGRAVTVNFQIACPTTPCPTPTPAPVPSPTPNPEAGDPTKRPPESPDQGTQEACEPPQSEGLPVSVASGNAYADQEDATIAGVSGIRLIRSYNGLDALNDISGPFGRGWTHSYDQTLRFPASSTIELRRGNGSAVTFVSTDGGASYIATAPKMDHSYVVPAAPGWSRVLRNGGSEMYDSDGRLSEIRDAVGNRTIISRDSGRRITSVADPGGRTLTFAYSGTHITSVSGPPGILATYTYEGDSLLQVTYNETAPNTSGFSFRYDASGQLLAVYDFSGRQVEGHTYSGGKAITSEIANGRGKFTFSYGIGQTVVTNANANTTTYDFVDGGGVKRITGITGSCSACGSGNESQHWSYNADGRIATRTDGLNKSTTYEYHPDTGYLTSQTDALLHTTTYTRDSQGRPLTISGPDGSLVTFFYDAAGPRTITARVDATQSTTMSLTYDSRGKLATITDGRGKVTTRSYTAAGDLASVTDPLGKVTTYAYDSMGRVLTVTDPLSNVTQATYDARGRLNRITDPVGGVKIRSYDAGGRLTKSTNELGRVTSSAYDSYGRPQFVTDAMGGVTAYDYDLAGNPSELTDASSNITRFGYDAWHRLQTVTYPNSRTESYTYDAAGRLATRTDRRGVVTTHTYDELGRLSGKTYSDATPPVSFTYDDAGRVLTGSNAVDTITRTYDLIGQLRSENSSANDSTISYLYDTSGNRTQLTLTGGTPQDYNYDDASRLTRITRGNATFVLAYDAAGRQTSLAYPNSRTAAYAYDKASHLLSLKLLNGNKALDQWIYTYDLAGNPLTKQGSSITETYTYDVKNQLTQVKRGTSATESFTYDPVGNRLSALNDPSWTYDEQNQLLSRAGSTYMYDAAGNLQTKAEGSDNWAYEWDAENRLTRVTKNSAETARFAYDAFGRRIRKSSATTKAFLYDGADVIREVDSAATTTYVRSLGIDDPLAVDTGSGLTFLHKDALGSITTTSSSAGTVSAARQYDSYGNLQLGSTSSGIAFTGREWDAEIGLYYYRARYYDPKVGRFLSEDPLRFDGGDVNLYAYVRNNPVLFTDPTGEIIQVCNREAKGMPGNHTYLYDPATGRNCGRGSNSGKETPKTDPTTACVDVPGSEGFEDKILKCCEEQRKHPGIFFPPVNDCHTLKDKALDCAGMPKTPAPGGRTGCPTCPEKK